MNKTCWAHRVTVVAACALLFVLAPSAHAHTTIAVQATEGTRSDNALRIGHGCEDGDEAREVIAQSVVFPTDQPVLSASDPNATPADLTEVIAQGDLAGLARLVQDRSIFLFQAEKRDANGNAIGFVGRSGRLREGLRGRVPFEFTPPSFLADSCVKSLRIQVAIADICVIRGGRIEAGKLNLWIPDNGSAIATRAAANQVDGVGSPANLIVNRNLATNPLPGGCGDGIQVTVTPSAAQVDRDLPIPRFWVPR
jgi:hypothetical protein